MHMQIQLQRQELWNYRLAYRVSIRENQELRASFVTLFELMDFIEKV